MTHDREGTATAKPVRINADEPSGLEASSAQIGGLKRTRRQGACGVVVDCACAWHGGRTEAATPDGSDESARLLREAVGPARCGNAERPRSRRVVRRFMHAAGLPSRRSQSSKRCTAARSTKPSTDTTRTGTRTNGTEFLERTASGRLWQLTASVGPFRDVPSAPMPRRQPG